MKKLFTILAGTFFCFGATLLMPFAGEGSGISPIPSAWAAPGCVDADNDTFYKYHPKGCPHGNDPDDSDPCVTPDATSCGGGGGDTGGTAPDYYNLARASFATKGDLYPGLNETELAEKGGVFADGEDHCGGYDYWDWQDALLTDEYGVACESWANSSNVSGGGRWFLISSPAGSEEVLDVIERWLVVDFTDFADSRLESPCYDLDFGDEGYAHYGIPLYRDGVPSQSGGPVDQIVKNSDPCIDNLAIRLSADRILKAKANQQQLEFSIRWRPDPDASIYWSPWGYVSYIQPLFLRDPSTTDLSDPFHGRNCRVMSTRLTHTSPHTRDEAELLMELGPGQTLSLGTYLLPMEVCVKRASD